MNTVSQKTIDKRNGISDSDSVSLQHLSTLDVSDSGCLETSPRGSFVTARFSDVVITEFQSI